MKPDYSEDDPKECVVTKEERIQLLDAQLAQLAREKRQCEHLLPILFLAGDAMGLLLGCLLS